MTQVTPDERLIWHLGDLMDAVENFFGAKNPKREGHIYHCAARIMDEVIAPHVAAATASAWRPIETAPKDGTRIIVYRPTAKRYPKIGGDYWSTKYEPCWAKSPYDEQPTHWMLPSPPALANKEPKP